MILGKEQVNKNELFLPTA